MFGASSVSSGSSGPGFSKLDMDQTTPDTHAARQFVGDSGNSLPVVSTQISVCTAASHSVGNWVISIIAL